LQKIGVNLLEFSEIDSAYLRSKIEKGEVVLVLGAGCVRDCTNAARKQLQSGDQLAEKIAVDAGFPYNGEPLPTVLDAVQLPIPQLNSLLEAEFKGCVPSTGLNNAFIVPWWRVYTFNIDDTIEGMRGTISKQRIYSYNAMHAKVSPHEGASILHLVHLNGYVRELDKGVIFSKLDYDRRLSQSDAHWYREFATDHFRHCSIFIGTKLNEPLLWTALESVREASPYSRSFLIIPDALTVLQIASFKSRGITVLRGTFEDFVGALRKMYPAPLEWTSVVAAQSGIPANKDLAQFTREDVDALYFARRIVPGDVAAKWRNLSETEIRRLSAIGRRITLR